MKGGKEDEEWIQVRVREGRRGREAGRGREREGEYHGLKISS